MACPREVRYFAQARSAYANMPRGQGKKTTKENASQMDEAFLLFQVLVAFYLR